MNIKRDFVLSFDEEVLMDCRGQNEAFGRMLQKPGYGSAWQTALVETRQFVRPAAIWDTFPIREVRYERLVLDGNLRMGSGRAVRTMEGADALILGVCTLGSAISERILHYQRSKDILVGVLMDDLSSWAIEQVRRQLETLLKAESASEGLYVTAAFSPGGGDWPVKDQGVVFELLDAGQIGVTLSDFMVMSPLKSLSMVMGCGMQPIGAGARMPVAPRVIG